PSSGSASSVVTRIMPLPARRRLSGSRNTAKAAAEGTKAASAPMITALVRTKKERRSSGIPGLAAASPLAALALLEPAAEPPGRLAELDIQALHTLARLAVN